MEMKITFPGGSRVNAEYKGFVIETDQPVHLDGDGSAPAPFDHFLASIGTCAGYYVYKFLSQRNLSTEGAHVVLSTAKDPKTRMVSQIDLKVTLPEGFPEKYEKAIINAVNLCSVKRHILTPPTFNTTVSRATGEPASKGSKPTSSAAR